jgi:hypothetical protein
MPKQVDLTTGQEVPLDSKVVKIINDEPTTMREFAKFAIGKHVRIHDRIHGHEFEIGQVVQIVNHDNKYAQPWLCSDGEENWWIGEDEATVCEFAERVESNKPSFNEDEMRAIAQWLNTKGYNIDLNDDFWMEEYDWNEHNTRDICRLLFDFRNENIVDDFLQTEEQPNK